MLQKTGLIIPDWPAPPCVKAFFTTRAGGVSSGAYSSLNLGAHVGDEPQNVAENRRRLYELLPTEPVWLNQVHGVNVVLAEAVLSSDWSIREADGVVTARSEMPCAVMVADCLPVLFCTEDGSRVGAAHAGWRGLASGVLERTVEAMATNPARIIVWLGPAIGADAFEVGANVFDAFSSSPAECVSAFRPIAGRPDKYHADICALARQRLHRAGVHDIYGGQFCTVNDPKRFFSYRRDGKTGRMAGLIWIT